MRVIISVLAVYGEKDRKTGKNAGGGRQAAQRVQEATLALAPG